MKYNVITAFFAALFLVSVLATTAIGQALPITIDKVEIDDTVIQANQSNRLSLERGQTYEVEVKLSASRDVDDLELRAFLSGFEYSTIIPIEDRLSPFDLDANVTYVKKLHLPFPIEAEEDAYNLRLVLSDRNSDTMVVNYPIKVDVPRHFIQVEDVVLYPSGTVQAGSALLVTVRVQNNGEKDEDDIKVTASIPDLGVSNVDYIDEIRNEEEEETEEIFLRIPECAETGTYPLNIEVVYDEGFTAVTEKMPVRVASDNACSQKNDGDADQKDSAPKTLIVIGSQLETLTQGGEGVLYPITITNNGKTSKAYTLLVQGVNFGEMRISPTSTVVLEPGKTQSLYVFVKANKDAAPGPQVFTATVLSGGETLDQISLTAQVQEKTAGSVQTVLEIGLIVLVIILIIVALVVAFNRSKNNKEDEDEEVTTETYY